MKTLLIFTGKTADKEIAKLTERYIERIEHYIQFETAVVPDIKNAQKLSFSQVSQIEGEGILKLLREGDYVILLDEHGEMFRSIEFAKKFNRLMTSAPARRLVFIIGGPYGFSPQVKAKAKMEISLSLMTFSHQMIRMIFVEQLYRALTILNNQPYHHE